MTTRYERFMASLTPVPAPTSVDEPILVTLSDAVRYQALADAVAKTSDPDIQKAREALDEVVS